VKREQVKVLMLVVGTILVLALPVMLLIHAVIDEPQVTYFNYTERR